MIFLSSHKKGVVIKIHVQPRSAKNKVCGLHGDALKIKLTGPPVEGVANKQCLVFLSKFLGIPRTRLEIISGHKSRQKRVLIHQQLPQNISNLEHQIAKSLAPFFSKNNLTDT